MKAPSLDFLIVGGGIAGLACALALAREGIGSIVLEQSTQFRELGAGVQLGPNALRALQALGLREKLDAYVSWPGQVMMRDVSTGKALQSLKFGASFQKRFGESYACMHRGDLLQMLLSACRDQVLIKCCIATSVERIEEMTDSIHAVCADGTRFEGCGLIAADGLWSKLRAQLMGDEEPRYSGDVALRALVPHDGSQSEVGLWLGPRQHVVTYPVRGGQALNMVAIVEYPQGRLLRGWDEAAPQQLLGQFKLLHPALAAQLVKASHYTAWALFDREPLTQWSRGRAVLVGDAAHPSLQYLAQGACFALEDAVSLARRLGANRSSAVSNAQSGGDPSVAWSRSSVALAFAQFSQERQARGARLIRTARSMGQLYHARGGFRLARNVGLRVAPEWVSREFMAWLYEG